VFRGANAMEVLVHHARTAAQAPSERTELPVPEALDALVLSLLEKDPERRPASALVLSRLLDESVPAASWSEERAVAWWDAHRPV
jgi:hypothetical protein